MNVNVQLDNIVSKTCIMHDVYWFCSCANDIFMHCQSTCMFLYILIITAESIIHVTTFKTQYSIFVCFVTEKHCKSHILNYYVYSVC